jgi:hypothetical protein
MASGASSIRSLGSSADIALIAARSNAIQSRSSSLLISTKAVPIRRGERLEVSRPRPSSIEPPADRVEVHLDTRTHISGTQAGACRSVSRAPLWFAGAKPKALFASELR